MTREEFEREFNSRTLAYHPDYRADDLPVVITLAEEADCEPGHLLATALVNQLARAHRRLVLVGDFDVPLQCVDHFGFGTLAEATAGLARAINPFIEVDLARVPPSSASLISFGIGRAGCELDLGADGWFALLGDGVHLQTRRTSIFGALLASCLAASVAFHRVLGKQDLPSGTYSLWDYGRQTSEQGPDFVGPVDVGRVLQVGAGAVGSGLDYFLNAVGFTGRWVVSDGDVIEVSNLNRQLLFVAADAGYPDGLARNKAEVVAERVGLPMEASPVWYGYDDAVVTDTFDLVLPLANEYAARPALQQRAQTVLLHGTTSSNWEAQVHRHVAGHDGCISCRMPETPGVQFGCAEGSVGTETRQDTSLPFLAATASLLLLTEIVRLQEGTLMDSDRNYRALIMQSPIPTLQELRYPCAEGCKSWMPAERRLERTAGTLFAELDGARVASR